MGTSAQPREIEGGARAALLAELRSLEDRARRARAELVALGVDALPGLHLVLEVAGQRALLSAQRVAEVVQLVGLGPLPGARAEVAGDFLWRGTPVVVVDLAAVLGRPRLPALDARIVVLASSPPVGLLVDAVERLVDTPRVFRGEAPAGAEAFGGALSAGLCVDGGDVLPLLEPGPLAAGVAP
ncbi:MAG: chemotaxis protein CheW [Anaeromyxobacteraceae bacterium]